MKKVLIALLLVLLATTAYVGIAAASSDLIAVDHFDTQIKYLNDNFNSCVGKISTELKGHDRDVEMRKCRGDFADARKSLIKALREKYMEYQQKFLSERRTAKQNKEKGRVIDLNASIRELRHDRKILRDQLVPPICPEGSYPNAKWPYC